MRATVDLRLQQTARQRLQCGAIVNIVPLTLSTVPSKPSRRTTLFHWLTSRDEPASSALPLTILGIA
jgi:hypothetical protein